VPPALRGAHHQDRRAHAGVAQLHALLDEADGEAAHRAGRFERDRDAGRAVPVGVGLHDRPQRGAGELGDGAGVVGQGA
jgi:hypothetical protein